MVSKQQGRKYELVGHPDGDRAVEIDYDGQFPVGFTIEIIIGDPVPFSLQMPKTPGQKAKPSILGKEHRFSLAEDGKFHFVSPE